MDYIDLHLRLQQPQETPWREWGWSRGALVAPGDGPLPQGLVRGVELAPGSREELKRGLADLRGRASIVVVRSTDTETIRAAAQDARVDLLHSPGPLDHIAARFAQENHVALEFSLHPLIHTRGIPRANYLKAMGRNLMLARKYGAPMVLTTQARDPLDLRAPREAEAMGEVLGFTPAEARRGLTEAPAAILQRRGL